MSDQLLVAPREIVDVVYRASRVAGADSGVASLIGRAACFAVGQLGGRLDNVVDALDAGSHPSVGFTALAHLEVEAVRSGEAAAALEPAMTVADLALACFQACRRGVSITMICGDGERHTPHTWLGSGRAALAVSSLTAVRSPPDRGLLARVESRHREALRNGVPVPETHWRSLHEHAGHYLVSEALIDSAEVAPPQ